MTKVEELKKYLQDALKDKWSEQGSGYWIDKLIQVVRDEEFEKHEAAGGFSCCAVECIEDCPAKGTKYCEQK